MSAMRRHFLSAASLLITLALISPAHAKDDTIRVATSTLPLQQANPFTSALMPTITTTGAVFDTLTKFNRAGQLEPWLALRWARTDGNTWRFALRPGVTFSNGKPLNAASVVAAANYIISRTRPTENIVREIPKMISARVVDDLTVDITTAEPSPLFARYASMLVVPDIAALDDVGIEQFAKAPVGSGPYQLVDWSPARVTFVANEKSWRKPIIPNLQILVLSDTITRTQALLSDQADIGVFLGPEEYEMLTQAGHQALAWADDTVNGLALVTTRNDSPFKDVRVRRALNIAINRPPMLKAIFAGQAKPANQPATRGEFGYNPDLPQFDYDPAKARALLLEAGYPNGVKFTMEMTGVFSAYLAVYQQIAADLKRVGVDVEIRTIASPQFLKNVFMTGEYAEAFNMPWTGVPVGDLLRGVEMHSCAHNVPWTCDKAIMPLIERIKGEWDEQKSLALRRELMAYYHDQVPAIFIYESVTFSGARKNVKGLTDMFGFIPFDRISFKN